MGSSAQSGVNVDREAARTFTLGERIKLGLISWAGYLLVRVIGATLRYELITEPGCLGEGFDSPPLSIWCFWHRCVIPATYRLRGNKIAVMTSRSFDGEYIARIIQKLGYIPVRGSSSRGGAAALLGMRTQLEQGHAVAFTIDGPRGPRYIAKPGPVVLAKKTGVPISCFYVALKSAWVLNSWDRMMIPKPFSRAAFYASSPIHVPPDATNEQMSGLHQQMQEALERCRAKAEAVFSK
ncbi:MAG TPA: lysophospholipid acyltransferase family protein [Candidatus Angelobacter sp.]|nr:lysophospholipid acyltransferase family protein [Candidatus Angelobacter sp.]